MCVYDLYGMYGVSHDVTGQLERLKSVYFYPGRDMLVIHSANL